MRNFFNDSSGVAGCLNFNNSNANKETCLKLKKFFYPIAEKNESMYDQKSTQRQKDMYMSRYKLDFKNPLTNSSDNNDLQRNSKCMCEHCEEKNVNSYPHKPFYSTFDPISKNTENKNWSKSNSHNSLINCVKNLKLTNKFGKTVSEDISNIHSKRKVKKIKKKPVITSKASTNSISTSSKKNCLLEPHLKSKSNFKAGVFENKGHLKSNKPIQPSMNFNQVRKDLKIVSQQSLNSVLNENFQKHESRTTTSSVHSVKDHLFDVNRFNRINHDYDIENYFCKNYKANTAENNPSECFEKTKTKPTSKQQNSTQVNNKFASKSLIFDEQNIRHMKKAFLIEDLNSNTNVFNHKTRDVCQNGTNVCRHISLVCDKCIENVNLKNFKLYKCDLINDVMR